jgi:predicted CopG family antitoxin
VSDLPKRDAISNEAHELLKRVKRSGESFTVVIRDLPRGRLSDIAGSSILSQEDWDAIKKELSASQENC